MTFGCGYNRFMEEFMDRFLVFLADGFEEIEALTLVDYFRRADIFVDTVSVGDDLFVCGSHNIIVKADRLIDDIDLDFYDGIYIPGGSVGAKNLRDDKRVIDIVKKFDEEKKIICAICAGPTVLDRAGIVSDRNLVCHPSVEKSLLNVGYKRYDWEETRMKCIDDSVCDSLSYEHQEDRPKCNCPKTKDEAEARCRYNDYVQAICEIMVDIKACEILKKNLKDDDSIRLTPRQVVTFKFD